jgi:hypothetical protein
LEILERLGTLIDLEKVRRELTELPAINLPLIAAICLPYTKGHRHWPIKILCFVKKAIATGQSRYCVL